jgi:O-antigen/teichoic acid export membrane protein
MTTVIGRLRGRVVGTRLGTDDSRAILVSSVALIGGKVATMGFGFLAWIVAARMYPTAEVGLASGAVAAVTLCAQIALIGVGSAVITLLPTYEGRPGHLLDTSVSLLTLSGLGTALAFLLFAGTVLQELRVVAADPVYAVLFAVLAVAGTLGVLFDQASTARRRGNQVLLRGVAAGVTTLLLVAVIAIAFGGTSSQAIFVAWVIGGLVTWSLGLVTLGRSFPGYRYRPRLSRSISADLVRVGMPNYLLTLTERAPGFVLPIVVTELLSPADNAHWYIAWMMAWVVFVIPIQVGMTSFAEISREPARLRAIVEHGIRSSLVMGVAAAVGLAIVGGPALHLLGSGYAAAGLTPLWILLVGVVPMTFIQAYFSLSRARRELGPAIALGAVNSVASIVVPGIAGVASGLAGMAVAWLAVQCVTAVAAVWRLRALESA